MQTAFVCLLEYMWLVVFCNDAALEFHKNLIICTQIETKQVLGGNAMIVRSMNERFNYFTDSHISLGSNTPSFIKKLLTKTIVCSGRPSHNYL